MKLYPFIEAEKVAVRNVARACVLLGVSRSAYYTHRAGPSPRQVADTELAAEITEVHTQSKGRYGAPRVHAVLARKGHRHGRKRVARLMAAQGLRGRAPHQPPAVGNHFHQVVAGCFTRAGVEVSGRHRGLHSLRHSVAVGMLESGTAYPVIGAVLGHADANTTRRYLRVDIAHLRPLALEVPDAR